MSQDHPSSAPTRARDERNHGHATAARATALLIVLALLRTFATACGATRDHPAEAALSEADALDVATDAYVYGYPLVTMEYTRRAITKTVPPQGTTAPMGQLVRMCEYPNAQFKAVSAPNADTLYTTGWFDVDKEPWVITVPDMGDRYFLLPMLDGWTNVFASPGTRTTGGEAQPFATTGPNWHGTLPACVTEYQSPTPLVWLLGRINCTGKRPADQVHGVDKIRDHAARCQGPRSGGHAKWCNVVRHP